LGFKILEFSIGMGPKIVGKEKNGILYCVRAFPIGGMCRFYGEDEAAKDSLSFNAHKVWKRFLVVLAGPMMNILCAVLFAVLTLLLYGEIVPQVDSFSAESTPAQQAGMEPGDILYAIDGEKIQYYSQTTELIRAGNPDQMRVTVERDGEKKDLIVEQAYDEEKGYNTLGIMIRGVRKTFGFFEAIGASFGFVWSMILEMFAFLGSIFTVGIQQGDIVGPVGTIGIIGAVVRIGFENVLRLAVLLSVNLGIMNILPLPALDGGRLVFLAIEGIRGKPISAEKEGMVHFIGIILLFGLMIVLTFQDIAAFFR